MKHLKAIILGSAIAVATMASGSALATVVDNIQFNPGAIFQSAQLYETQVGATGDTLSGFGMINSINGDTHYCADGGADCQLTFTFTGYTVTSINATQAVFSGGTITFYAFDSYVFDPSNPATADPAGSSVFLTTQGHTFYDPTNGTGTLIATTSFPGSFLSDQFQGHGTGLLDVTGGDAQALFNTNTFVDNLLGFADIQFISDFSPNTCEGTGVPNPPYAICGSGTAKSFAIAVPEPNALGMMGLGLAGLALLLTRRRKGKEAA
ncbi:MAG: PEP-CTERM sorting domain-containing protein [Rhodanobacteraceae bacterium]